MIEVAAGEQATGIRLLVSYGTGTIRGEVKMSGAVPEGVVVRVSRGTFDPARFAEVQAMTIATGRYLVPAISGLPGLIVTT